MFIQSVSPVLISPANTDVGCIIYFCRQPVVLLSTFVAYDKPLSFSSFYQSVSGSDPQSQIQVILPRDLCRIIASHTCFGGYMNVHC